MRLNFAFFFLLLTSFTADAQKLTGIWRGYFSSSNGISRENTREETYKYEIQIDQQSNNGIRGVTYSYKTTVFFGKAALSGIYTTATKSLILKETKMTELKIGDNSEPCLMTCYLDYTKMGKLEILEGNFVSYNVKDKGDCGSGKVYLERVTTSDFKKEDFLTKKQQEPVTNNKSKSTPAVTNTGKTKPVLAGPAPTVTKKDNLVTKSVPVKPSAPQSQKQVTSGTAKVTTAPVTKPAAKPVQKTGTATHKPAIKDDKALAMHKPAERIPEESINSKTEEKQKEIKPPPGEDRKMPIPRVLLERENNLVKTITTSEENIQVDLYDNGTIDNDTISVYHNNELVVSHGRLSYTAISFKVKCSKTDNRHELIIVADNLGDIPPNTALMVVTTGNNKARYEITLASTEQRNAKVVINYVPKE
jgi:hypothetical protein